MALSDTAKRLIEIYRGKISRGLELTEEEEKFVKSNRGLLDNIISDRLVYIYESRISKGIELTDEEIKFIQDNVHLLHSLNRMKNKKEYILFVLNDKFPLTKNQKLELIKSLKDDSFILDFLKNNRLKLPIMDELFSFIKDEDIRKQYIESIKEPLSTRLMDGYIHLHCKDSEKKKIWSSKIKRVKDITELGIEELARLPNDVNIRICGDYVNSWQKELYPKWLYRRIIEKINKKFEDIEPAIAGDIDSELNTLEKVCSIISEIPYDEQAERIGNSNDFFGNPLIEVASQNLEGAFIFGTCVCEGYAESLRNVLPMKRIECRFVSATIKNTNSGHAWNQVKVGGKWFNLDLTWDLELIRRCRSRDVPFGKLILLSDEEFKNHDNYILDRPKGVEKCDTKITDLIKRERKNRIRNIFRFKNVEQEK